MAREALEADRKVQEILDLITTGRISSTTKRELAQKWGYSELSVGDLMSTAFRIIRLATGSWQQQRDVELARLDHVWAECFKACKPVVVAGQVEMVPCPDLKTAAQVVQMKLNVLGANVRGGAVRRVPDGSLDDLRQRRDAAKNAINDLDAAIAELERSEVH